MDVSIVEILPYEILRLILNELPDSEVSRMCSSSKIINVICDDDEFWHDRYDEYFAEDIIPELVGSTWKTIYKAYKNSNLVPIQDGHTGKFLAYYRFFLDAALINNRVIDLLKYIHSLDNLRNKRLHTRIVYNSQASIPGYISLKENWASGVVDISYLFLKDSTGIEFGYIPDLANIKEILVEIQ